MNRLKSQPCSLGNNDVERNNPSNPEMALAFAIHDYSQQLLKMSRSDRTLPSFNEWLRTVESSIKFYRKNHASRISQRNPIETLEQMRVEMKRGRFATDAELAALDAAIQALKDADREREFICRKCGLRQELGVRTEPKF